MSTAEPAVSRRLRILVPALAVAATVVIALARLVITGSFYFVDDTQAGSIGQWHALGEYLTSGVWPMLNPHAWTGGNYLAEGQWGLFSPLIWLISVGSLALDDVVVYATIVKIVLLAVMALGAHLLARSFGANVWWAGAAAVLVPLGGFTVYMDAASWTGGLMASALFPWAWWGLKVAVDEHRSPIWYAVGAGLLITTGYVFGVMMLVIVLVERLVRALVARDRAAIGSTLLASVFGALLTVTVYLPGVLTAGVTIRDGFEIYNLGFLNADLGDLAATAIGTTTASVMSWPGITDAPLMFVAWVLPAFAFFVPVARRTVVRCLPLLIVGATTLLLVTGPSHVGPLRWPVRFMPYFVLAVVVLLAVCASQAYPRVVTRARLFWALGLVAAGAWFSIVIVVTEWRRVGISVVVQLVGILALYLIARSRRVREERRHPLAASATAFVAAVVAGLQMLVFPASPLPQFAVIDSADELASVPGDVPGDVFVVGDVYAWWAAPDTFEERLLANQWYFSDVDVASVYTVLPHAAYTTDLCADLRGSTCRTAIDTLFSVDDATGVQVATLLGANTVLAINGSFPRGVPEAPEGWTIDTRGDTATTYVRDEPVPTAGGVSWSSDGTVVETVSQSDTRLELRVESVGADPTVVLSRLNWPGYTLSGAQWDDPTRGYLLTLDLSDAQPGDTVVVEFRPPGWYVEIGALILALVIAAGWPIARVVRRRRSAHVRTAA